VDDALTAGMRRVLVALWAVTTPGNPGARIPLRRTASAILNGDPQGPGRVSPPSTRVATDRHDGLAHRLDYPNKGLRPRCVVSRAGDEQLGKARRGAVDQAP
jgi:hypothetical protein